MKVHIATDHSGLELKDQLVTWLKAEGHEVMDHGAHELDPTDDYTDFVIPAARAVAADDQSVGVVIGRSAQGEAMAANKIAGARAAVYYGSIKPREAVDASGETSDDPLIMIQQTRRHNHANILSLAAVYLSLADARAAVARFIEAQPENVGRHVRRVKAMEDALLSQAGAKHG